MKIARLLIAKQPKIRECLELKWDVAEGANGEANGNERRTDERLKDKVKEK